MLFVKSYELDNYGVNIYGNTIGGEALYECYIYSKPDKELKKHIADSSLEYINEIAQREMEYYENHLNNKSGGRI